MDTLLQAREIIQDLDRLRAEIDVKEQELRKILGISVAQKRHTPPTRSAREKRVVRDGLLGLTANQR